MSVLYVSPQSRTVYISAVISFYADPVTLRVASNPVRRVFQTKTEEGVELRSPNEAEKKNLSLYHSPVHSSSDEEGTALVTPRNKKVAGDLKRFSGCCCDDDVDEDAPGAAAPGAVAPGAVALGADVAESLPPSEVSLPPRIVKIPRRKKKSIPNASEETGALLKVGVVFFVNSLSYRYFCGQT